MSEMSKKGGHTMKLLITLSLAALTLYAYTKRYQRYASLEDQVDTPPIDFEETRGFKDNEVWFAGIR